MKPRQPLAWALLLVPLLAAPARAADGWQPDNTCAVIVGVLSWEDKALGSFSARHRKDQELYDTLRQRGVPKDNMALLLDKEATLDGIRASLKAVAEKAKPDATLIFYYAGHGTRKDGVVRFLNYDYSSKQPEKSALAVAEVGELCQRHFKGGRVLLLADCCHSGGLGEVAQGLTKAGVKAASLTSADASNISTGNWTFTQTVLDALHGDPLADADGNGTITLDELAEEVAAAMKFREGQRHGYANPGLGRDYGLVPAEKKKRPEPIKGDFALKEYVLAKDGGAQRPARVVDFAGGKYAVEFYDYSDKRTAHLPAAELSKIQFKTYKVGDEVTVLWGGQPYAAKVLKVAGDFHYITYPGWDSSWDEWVLSNRIADAGKK